MQRRRQRLHARQLLQQAVCRTLRDSASLTLIRRDQKAWMALVRLAGFGGPGEEVGTGLEAEAETELGTWTGTEGEGETVQWAELMMAGM